MIPFRKLPASPIAVLSICHMVLRGCELAAMYCRCCFLAAGVYMVAGGYGVAAVGCYVAAGE
jgi:hypothetical protein